jgi:hypothetical protein
MAKKKVSISLKGILHNDNIIEEFGKKEEDPSEFHSLEEILDQFRNKHISISINEEASIEPMEE